MIGVGWDVLHNDIDGENSFESHPDSSTFDEDASVPITFHDLSTGKSGWCASPIVGYSEKLWNWTAWEAHRRELRGCSGNQGVLSNWGFLLEYPEIFQKVRKFRKIHIKWLLTGANSFTQVSAKSLVKKLMTWHLLRHFGVLRALKQIILWKEIYLPLQTFPLMISDDKKHSAIDESS
jgi:hypothetical protein